VLRFNDIVDRMLEYSPSLDLELLQRAYVFSAKVHEGQERLSGEPYLIHPLEVAGVLVELRMDEVTVAAALLHDTLEDTLTTEEELQRLFGEEVAFIVEGLTKIAKIEFKSARERQAENFRKMLLAMSKDIRILLIKLADRLHNMRTLEYMKEESRQRIAQETLDIYVPLAHRLGIRWMMQELEDLAFRTLHPHVVEELERQLIGGREEREKYIEEVIGILSSKLTAAGLDVEVKGRLKDLASIYKKMQAQDISLDQIYDVIAFRVVIDGPAESCYTALGLIHGTWRPVPSRFKDYLGNPKPNGYRSLHTTVIGPYGERMEVQIRTVEMDVDAEYGIAAHWKYKAGKADDHEHDERFGWLRQLLEWQSLLADPHEFLDFVKVDLFPDEVFVFTPRGEVINLPRRATAIDFAYAIHSEVGDHCAGAKVNGKMVPLRHTLVDGDTVEIITSDQQFPRKDWLEFVVSGKARNHIRHAIRASERRRARELGRDILSREMRRAGLSLARAEASGALDEIARGEIRGGDAESLFAAVSYGKLAASSVVQKLVGGKEAAAPAREEEKSVPVQERLLGLFKRSTREPGPESGIRVSGLADVLVRFGGCCDPLPGDEVIGFVTRGRGVTVHARSCPRVFELDPARRIDVEWDTTNAVPRKVRVRATTRDRPGILAKITNAISASGINIAGVKVTTDEQGNAQQSFELWVTNTKTLDSVLKEISRVKGVISVDRVRA
jgi:GTP pyrophosphokinase